MDSLAALSSTFTFQLISSHFNSTQFSQEANFSTHTDTLHRERRCWWWWWWWRWWSSLSSSLPSLNREPVAIAIAIPIRWSSLSLCLFGGLPFEKEEAEKKTLVLSEALNKSEKSPLKSSSHVGFSSFTRKIKTNKAERERARLIKKQNHTNEYLLLLTKRKH